MRLRHLKQNIPQSDIDNCIKAYEYFQNRSDFGERDQVGADRAHARPPTYAPGLAGRTPPSATTFALVGLTPGPHLRRD